MYGADGIIKWRRNCITYIRLVPGLKNMPVPVLLTRKFRYTNRAAPLQRPFLLAGEVASPAGRVLVVLVLVLACFFRPGTLLLLFKVNHKYLCWMQNDERYIVREFFKWTSKMKIFTGHDRELSFAVPIAVFRAIEINETRVFIILPHGLI